MKIKESRNQKSTKKAQRPKIEFKNRESGRYLLQSKIHAKNEFEVESSPSKSKSREYLPTNEKIARLQKGKNSAPEFQRVSSLQEPPKKTRMTPKYRARKYKKNDGANYKLTQQ